MTNDNVTLEDVIGHADAKQALLDRFEIYIKHKEYFKKLNAKPPSGILLHGAPGTGKTMLLRACHNSIIKNNPNLKYKEITLSQISGGNIIGEAQKKIYGLFNTIKESDKDWILVFDEMDIICPDRLRTKSVCSVERTNSLLSCLDGLDGKPQNVFVVGTTNRISQIDGAIRRSGRFDDVIEIGLPTIDDNIQLSKKYLSGLDIEGNFNLISKCIGEYGHSAGWAGSEYNLFRTKLVTLHIQNHFKKLSNNDICMVAGKINAGFRRDETGRFIEWQKTHA